MQGGQRHIREREKSPDPVGALSYLFSVVVTWAERQETEGWAQQVTNTELLMQQLLLPRAETRMFNIAHYNNWEHLTLLYH